MIDQDDGPKKPTKNAWKYLSFVLMGILAFGVTVTTLPQAMAKPPDGSPGEDMMMLLTQIRDAVLGVQETADEINEKTGFKTIEFDLNRNPSDDGNEVVEILPFVEDHAYTGHFEMALIANNGNDLIVSCGTENTGIGGFQIVRQEDGSSGAFERDFTCASLSVVFVDRNDGTDAPDSFAVGILSYTETDEVTSIE